MKELLAVEFSPAPRRKEKFTPSPICGAVGETFSTYLKREPEELIPVRFPLVGPGSYRRLLSEKRDPHDVSKFLGESTLLPRKWIHQVGRTPVSLYREVAGKLPSELFEKPEYLRIVSRDKLREVVEAMGNLWTHTFLWKKEWVPVPEKVVFVEARIYGIDTVINTYDPRKLQGAAVQVIVMPQATESNRAAGIMVQRCVSDTIIIGNSAEYISYLDGVTIPREKTTIKAILGRYEKTLSAREYMNSKKGSGTKSEKNQTDKQYYAMPVEKKKTVGA